MKTEKFKASTITPKISLIIPTFNNLNYLKLLIESLFEFSHYNHEIIVHINEGKDGTLDWVRKRSDLNYTYSSENIGICRGVNFAASLATTDHIMYINDDMVASPEWDAPLVKEIEDLAGEDYYISSTMIEPYDSNNPAVIVKNFGMTPVQFNKEYFLKELHNIQKQDWNGATWPPSLMKKELWDQVGGLSLEFSPGMYSDNDLSMKLWKTGVRIFKGIGTSLVYHFGRTSTRRLGKSNGRKIFLRKWGITPSTFNKHYLKLGERYQGKLPEVNPGPIIAYKNEFKRRFL